MKQTLCFLLFLVSGGDYVMGQTDTLLNRVKFKMSRYESKANFYTKYIDFRGTNNIYLDTLRYDRKYKYTLKNVNRFVYNDAKAEQKGENLNEDRPDILKAIKLPGFITVNTIKSINDNSVSQAQTNYFGDSSQQLKQPCNCYEAKDLVDPALIDKLSNHQQMFNSYVEKFSTFSKLSRQLSKSKADNKLTFDSINASKIRLIQNYIGLSLTEYDTLSAISNHYDSLLLNTASIFSSDLIPTSDRLIKPIYEKILLLKNCLWCVDSCVTRIAPKDLLKPNSNLFFETRNCIEKLQAFINAVKSDLKEAAEAIEAMQTAIKDGKVDAIQRDYNLLVHENFELELEPFIADKDVHEITFTTVAGEPLEFGKPSNRIIKIKAITSGGLKIDYSTGVFINIGSNQFLGPDYYFENRGSDTTKVVREIERTKKSLLSIGALMHIYPRILSSIKPGLALGVSTTAGFDVLNFHGGLSLLIGKTGKTNRVVLSSGFTLREVALLDARFKVGEFRKDYPDTVPTSKNFPVWGYFGAITYNLKGINK